MKVNGKRKQLEKYLGIHFSRCLEGEGALLKGPRYWCGQVSGNHHSPKCGQ